MPTIITVGDQLFELRKEKEKYQKALQRIADLDNKCETAADPDRNFRATTLEVLKSVDIRPIEVTLV